MSDLQHADLTDPDIHEPKGTSAAAADTVYVADGAGSGEWKKVDEAAIDYSAVADAISDDIEDGDLPVTLKWSVLVVIDDVSTASSVIVPVLNNATFKKARAVLGGAISVANAVVSFKNAAAASMGTSLTIVQSGSAKGDGYTFTASANNVLTGPTWIEIATDGASTTAMPLYILCEFQGVLNG